MSRKPPMGYYSSTSIPVSMDNLELLIFDLDGVITSEQKYWNTARLTVWDLITSPNYLGLSTYFGAGTDTPDRTLQHGDQVIPAAFIYELKSRAVNSNWDLTFFVFSLHLVAILRQSELSERGATILAQSDLPIATKLQQVGQFLAGQACDACASAATIAQFWQETTQLTGLAVLEHLDRFIQVQLGVTLPSFQVQGDLWDLCYHNFQAWYEGKRGYQLPDDETVLDLAQIQATLQTLYQAQRYILAIATGRPQIEVLEPLTTLGLLSYFDPQRVVTYDQVLEAEAVMLASGQPIKLGKPHPYVLLKALHPETPVASLCAAALQPMHYPRAAYIGDAASDVVAAQTAGCIAIGVLTGFGYGHANDQKRQMLTDLDCDLILDSILELPPALGIQKPLSSTIDHLINPHIQAISAKIAGLPKNRCHDPARQGGVTLSPHPLKWWRRSLQLPPPAIVIPMSSGANSAALWPTIQALNLNKSSSPMGLMICLN